MAQKTCQVKSQTEQIASPENCHAKTNCLVKEFCQKNMLEPQ